MKKGDNPSLLFQLINATSPSGNEYEIKRLISKEIKKNVRDVKVDNFGNLIARKKGRGKKVMLVAHMDEIGLMIKSISDRGIISCTSVGGIEPVSVVGEKVHMQTKNKKRIHGVISLREISDGEEVVELPRMEDLVVDTGLSKKELKKLGIDVGTYIELDQQTEYLGTGKNIISGKALDDRLGCFILLELAKKLKKSKLDLYFVFTVQEEIGLYGAKTSVYHIEPDWAVVVDMTNADDIREYAHVSTKILGKGPCITIKDVDMVADPVLDDWLKKIAKKHKIPIQLEVSDFGTTDALSISVSKGGIPTAVVGVPIRNLHTTVSIADLRDVNYTIKLLHELLKNPPKFKGNSLH